MAASITLPGGDTFLETMTRTGVDLSRFSVLGKPLEAALVSNTQNDWSSIAQTASGGVACIWDRGGTLQEQDLDASGNLVGSAFEIATPPPPAGLAFSSTASVGPSAGQLATAVLEDGGYVSIARSDAQSSPSVITIQRHSFDGQPVGPAWTSSPADFAQRDLTIVPLADGGYLGSFVVDTSTSSTLNFVRFSPSDVPGPQQTYVSYPTTPSGGLHNLGQDMAVGLPDGGFVLAWTAVEGTGAPNTDVFVQEFNARSQALGGPVFVGRMGGANADLHLDAFANGRYVVSWNNDTGPQVAQFTEQQSSLGRTTDEIFTSDPNYVVPNGPHAITLVGAGPQIVIANNLGDLITENNAASTIHGGSGDDTIVAGRQGGSLDGGLGSDVFVFKSVPWSPGHITDFTHGTDKLDVTALLSKAGYAGADPIADGYVKLIDDGHGDTWLYFDSDGRGSADPWGSFIATLDHVAPSGVTSADLVGATVSPPPPPPPPPSGGQTLHGQAGGSNLQGGSGDDTLIGGTGADTMTGAGGADHFVWSQLPWSAARVTDFTHGVDKIDLSGLLASVHYAGADPIADGYVKLIADGHGDTWLYFDTDGRGAADPWGTFVATFNGVDPASLSPGDFIFR